MKVILQCWPVIRNWERPPLIIKAVLRTHYCDSHKMGPKIVRVGTGQKQPSVGVFQCWVGIKNCVKYPSGFSPGYPSR
jgi:hypothetical protein